MIRVANIDKFRSGPVIECDVCKFIIDNAGLGLVEWRSDNREFPEGGKIYTVHEMCHRKLEGDDTDWMSDELSAFLRRLAHNCNADMTPHQHDDGKALL